MSVDKRSDYKPAPTQDAPSLDDVARIVFPDQPKQQEAFKEQVIRNDLSVETLLSFTRKDDEWLKELGLNIGQRKRFYDWQAERDRPARGKSRKCYCRLSNLFRCRPRGERGVVS
jgi:hypothetical protein